MKMKLFSVFAACSATFIATAQAPTGPAVKSAPPPTTPLAAPVAANPVGQTDEVDLEEIDDAALADRQPSVKKAEAPAAAKTAEEKSVAADADAPELAYDENALVDITCEDATLADILRQFRKAIGANIISTDSSNLQQRVSVNLRHVPWYQSLQAILNTRNFRLEDRSGIYFVSEDKQAIPVFTRTYQLNHASSEELAKLFNDSYGTKSPDGKTMLQRVAVAFPGANTLVITASEKILADCEAIIKSVDKAVAQIYIEARFLELSNEALHKLGVQWNQLESWGATAKDISGGWEYNNGRVGVYKGGKESSWYQPKVYDASGNDISSGKSALDYVTQNYMVPDELNAAAGAGRTAEDMAWRNARGFSGQLSADDFRLAMSAFEQIGDGKVFSNPRVVVSNGKEAKVDMTTKFPYVKITSQRNTQNTTSYLDMSAELQQIPGTDKEMFSGSTFFSWGITLSVKPRISPDGLISVEIIPTISDLKEYYSLAQSDTDFGRFPVIEMKRLTTEFTMKDGATAVIGGLSKTVEDDVDSGIPYLRQIPWMGQKLFGWKSRQKVQKEIIVLVTIGIANPAELDRAIGLPTNAVLGREYVEGRRFEPGDRAEGVDGVSTLDKRTLDEQRAEEKKDQAKAAKTSEGRIPSAAPKGSVTITPVGSKAVRRPRD